MAGVIYRGRASHAAAAPQKGRSALAGLEIATHAINLLREHVPQETRMHYAITRGGGAANIVPDTPPNSPSSSATLSSPCWRASPNVS